MVKKDTYINAMMVKVINKHSNPIDFLPGADTQKLKDDKKHEMISEMLVELKKLYQKGQITSEHYKNAAEAINFYDKEVQTSHFQDHPKHTLSELTAIDYANPVKTVKIKKGRNLTQMQRVDNANGFSGNFYAEGILPEDYLSRADQSGIGAYTSNNPDSQTELAQKSVYISAVEADSTFLRSTAAPADDTWSIRGVTQKSQGGGAQWRVSSKDSGKIARPIYTEIEALHAPSTQKPLKRGMIAPELQASTLKNCLINQQTESRSIANTQTHIKKTNDRQR